MAISERVKPKITNKSGVKLAICEFAFSIKPEVNPDGNSIIFLCQYYNIGTKCNKIILSFLI